jgi:hypothetical protein
MLCIERADRAFQYTVLHVSAELTFVSHLWQLISEGLTVLLQWVFNTCTD